MVIAEYDAIEYNISIDPSDNTSLPSCPPSIPFRHAHREQASYRTHLRVIHINLDELHVRVSTLSLLEVGGDHLAGAVKPGGEG